jgi:hypothetical protein
MALASHAPADDQETEIPWTTLKLIGVVGGSILMVLIVVSMIIEYWPRKLELPKAEHISKLVEAAKKKLASPPEPVESKDGAETDERAPGDARKAQPPIEAAAEEAAAATGATPSAPAKPAGP